MRVLEGEAVPVRVFEGEAVPVRVLEGEGVLVLDGEGVLDGVLDGEGVCEGVSEGVGELETDGAGPVNVPHTPRGRLGLELVQDSCATLGLVLRVKIDGQVASMPSPPLVPTLAFPRAAAPMLS